jgi:hypothetical protein
VSHVWTVWVVFDRSGVFLKNPPARSVVTIGSNLFVNMQRRSKISQSGLNLTTRLFVRFPTRNICNSAPPCRSADIPNAATRSPAYDVDSYWSHFDTSGHRYKWTSHLSPEPRLVRVCTQTVPVVTLLMI